MGQDTLSSFCIYWPAENSESVRIAETEETHGLEDDPTMRLLQIAEQMGCK